MTKVLQTLAEFLTSRAMEWHKAANKFIHAQFDQKTQCLLFQVSTWHFLCTFPSSGILCVAVVLAIVPFCLCICLLILGVTFHGEIHLLHLLPSA